MASWFQRIIDTERWETVWNSMTELYALQLISSAFDGSAVMQFPTDIDDDLTFHIKADEYKKTQENWNKE